MPVARISLVSLERSKQIETILLRMAQTGQLRGKVTESQLIDLLEQVCLSDCLLHCKGSLSVRLKRPTIRKQKDQLWSVLSDHPTPFTVNLALQFQRRKDLDDDLDLDL